MKQVLENVHWSHRHRVSNCFLIENGDSLDLIDTSAIVELPLIMRSVKRIGKPIKRVLLTHSHQDHAGNINFFEKKFNAKIYAHQNEVPYLHGEAKLKKRIYKKVNPFQRIIQFGDFILPEPINKNTRSFEEDDVRADYEFVPLFGHTPGSTGILHKKSKSIFFGDALMNSTAVHLIPKPGLRVPYAHYSEDQDMALRNLKNIKDYNFENAFFGHGKPILGKAKDEIMSFLLREGLLQ